MTKNKGLRMLQIANKTEDKSFSIQLNTLPNPAAVIVELSCGAYKQREDIQNDEP